MAVYWKQEEAQQIPPPIILIANPDRTFAIHLGKLLGNRQYEIEFAFRRSDALKKIRQTVFDLIVTVEALPDGSIGPLLDELLKRSPLTQLLVLTEREKPPESQDLFQHSNALFIRKSTPVSDLIQRINDLLPHRDSSLGITEKPSARIKPPEINQSEIIGESPAIREIIRLISAVADTEANVLITGETGTGKELVARALHNFSTRRKGNFVPINCAAIPENLLEDDLFGHVQGAFTDAKTSKVGKFEAADSGTLFLDEIGEMPHYLQAKLLRVLEDGQVYRLGSERPVEVDFRTISATNVNLVERLKSQTFRTDLFYRLNVIHIQIPPLRERKEDIPLLVNEFLNRTCENYGLAPKQLHPGALRLLMNVEWPGNIRELKNIVEAVVAMSGDKKVLEAREFQAALGSINSLIDFGPESSTSPVVLPEQGLNLRKFLQDLEKNLILQSLARCDGNQKKAAKLLSLNRTTLISKLRKFQPVRELF